VARDSGANMVLAVKNMPGVSAVSCADHRINLCVKELMETEGLLDSQKFRDVVSAFRKSTELSSNLKTLLSSMDEDKRVKVLIQDVSTRWFSTYLMLERLILVKHKVLDVLSTSDHDPPKEDQWARAAWIVNLLRQLHKVLTKLEASKWVTISEVLVCYHRSFPWSGNTSTQFDRSWTARMTLFRRVL